MALAPEEVGARIQKAREAKGWKHRDLADAMHADLRTVQRWQKGQLPRLSTLMELADVLGVPQAYFIEKEDETATLQEVRDYLARQNALLEELLRRLPEEPEAPQDGDVEP